MRKLDPNDIPNILRVVVDMYVKNRAPTVQERDKIHQFFNIYMSKAIADCQEASKALWTPSKPKSEICFNAKTVEIDPKDETGGKVTFNVATTRSVCFNEKDLENFKNRTEEKMISEFSNHENWITVYNNLLFGPDRNNPNNHFQNGLFLCIRFSKEYFFESGMEALNDSSFTAENKTVH